MELNFTSFFLVNAMKVNCGAPVRHENLDIDANDVSSVGFNEGSGK